MSDDSSELSSVPSEDESDLQLKKKGGILKFFSKVNPKTEKHKKADSSPPPPEREPSPPHEYVLADNPDIAFIVMFRSRFTEAFPKSLANFGPQELERGVVDTVPGEHVEHFLCALLGLLLNRKQDVKAGHYNRALEEAVQTHKSQWAKDWESKNPLLGGATFTSMGPTERLTLLRTLVLWSLSSSDAVKSIITASYKQSRHEDDLNQPLSVQPWGSDSYKRRYFLIEGLDDTAFRVYRESNPAGLKRTWWSVAGDIEELKQLAEKLGAADNGQRARGLSAKMTAAIPRFEATEEKRRRREYRQIRKQQFKRPEPNYSMYEGRTRGKRIKYTYSDDDDDIYSDSTTRRSTRNTGTHTPAEPAGPTVTQSGRQVRSRLGGAYGESMTGSNQTPAIAVGGYDGGNESLGEDDSVNGRPPRRAAAVSNPRKGGRNIDGYNSVDDMDDEDDASEQDYGDDEEEDEAVSLASEGEEDDEDEVVDDDVDMVDELDELDAKKSLVVSLPIKTPTPEKKRTVTLTLSPAKNPMNPIPAEAQPTHKSPELQVDSNGASTAAQENSSAPQPEPAGDVTRWTSYVGPRAMAEYVVAGANRHPAAADWHGEVLAYGADRNIAIWNPQGGHHGVTTLLVGHTDTVNVVKFMESTAGLLLLSGSVDKTIRVWRASANGGDFKCIQILEQHEGSINCIAVSPNSNIVASGSADATFKIWEFDVEIQNFVLVQSISTKPRFFSLALALSPLNGVPGSYILAVAGTSPIVQLYVADPAPKASLEFRLKATLTGHEGWIRSLAFTNETDKPESDLLLSSASQDKYIRLWRIHQGKELPAVAAAGADPAAGAFLPGKSLSNKAHKFVAGSEDYSATFEALLLGHEDWIYSTAWKRRENTLQLLSASADNSLSIWEQDPSSSVWVSVTRLGEISAQKGSTTATGSTGGFWTGLWSPNGDTVVCLGKTGSWRLWNRNVESDQWMPNFGVGGHIRSVTGVAWSRRGDYLLSTSSDQTTRLHAKWIRGGGEPTWHEMARPQIHGYDLNCIDSLGESQFVSGADEKLLRVFSEPRAVAKLLQVLCGIEGDNVQAMPDAANMPVLGLSNKAIEAMEDDQEMEKPSEHDREGLDPATAVHKSTLVMNHPPLEDHLSRNTLWPEVEKLYGHGYEISALATSHDGSLVATACKASSLDHAVIRLFETKTWTQVSPPLTAHSLTVARLRFSADDKLLLSVGRDRQWAIFERASEGGNEYKLLFADPKGHSRMILDAAWAPGPEYIFATAGRDKQVKLWGKGREGSVEGGYAHVTSIKEDGPVTAIDFAGALLKDNHAWLAVGTEAGRLAMYLISLTDLTVVKKVAVDSSLCPAKAITQLSWKPVSETTDVKEEEFELAVASEDCSLRVLSLGRLLSTSP
ncbi:hypothetical protein V494_01033 [Pseudogymnoascus sp. VKM F-4513 (FW-928)]|nr:hypothetical protein V494_01033 [Pseudogymnoascus sp. VKM F-4513 (FW-928)]